MLAVGVFIQLESVATAIGVALIVPSIVYAGLQLRGSQKVARGDFLLRLDQLLNEHNEIHTRLRPGGRWAKRGAGPESVEDWVAVERYMGLFERIYVLVKSGIVDLETISRLYGYRVFNIVRNERIHQAKLEREAASWSDFIALWKSLESLRPG
jgi:hypothetical protein